MSRFTMGNFNLLVVKFCMRLLMNETTTYDLTACFHIWFRLDLHPNQNYLHTQYLIHHHSRSENHNLLKLQNVFKFVICI